MDATFPSSPPSSSAPSRNSLVITAVIAFIIGFGLAWIIVGRTPAAKAPTSEGQQAAVSQSQALEGENAIVVEDQTANATKVTAKLVDLENSGWVAIHENDGGKPRPTAFGAQWLAAGTYNDVQIELIRSLVGGKSYFASLRSDDGDIKFDSSKDLPVKDSQGNDIFMEFRVPAE